MVVNELLERAKRGDIDAFAGLFEPMRAKVFAVACRMVGLQDAEDVVMDTFLRAWKAIPGFRGESSLQTWVIRIARNRALDTIRSRRHQPEAVSLDDDRDGNPFPAAFDPGQPLPDEIAADREMADLARVALARIDEAHRAVLVLRYVDGLQYGEIAAALNIRIGTVMSRLFHGRRKWKAAMAERGGSEAI